MRGCDELGTVMQIGRDGPCGPRPTFLSPESATNRDVYITILSFFHFCKEVWGPWNKVLT